MQLKPIAATTVLLLVATFLLVAGCSTSETTNTPTPTPTDTVATINNAFTSQNFTISTPFKKSVNNQGITIYTGVVKNGERTLVPYSHNITIEETNNRTQSIARFNAYVAQAKQQEYTGTLLEEGMWYGKIGDGENPGKAVWVNINQPQWWGILLQGSKVEIDMWHDQYTVAVDYKTKA